MKRLLGFLILLLTVPAAAQEPRYIRLEPDFVQHHIVGTTERAMADCLTASKMALDFQSGHVELELRFGVEDVAAKVCTPSPAFGSTSVILIAQKNADGTFDLLIAVPEAVGGSPQPVILTAAQRSVVLGWVDASKGQFLQGLSALKKIRGNYVSPTP